MTTLDELVEHPKHAMNLEPLCLGCVAKGAVACNHHTLVTSISKAASSRSAWCRSIQIFASVMQRTG